METDRELAVRARYDRDALAALIRREIDAGLVCETERGEPSSSPLIGIMVLLLVISIAALVAELWRAVL